MRASTNSLIFVLLCLPFQVISQDTVQIDTFPRAAILAAQKAYADLHGQQLQFINGVQYKGIIWDPTKDRGHPFYLSDALLNGTLKHNHILYPNILLQYDAVSDQIITVLPNTNFKISLIKEYVQGFTIQGHSFVNLDSDKGIASGLYELLLDGKAVVVAKRTKRVEESNYNYNLDVRKQFISKDEWYIGVNDKFYLIGNKKALTRALIDQGQKINTFARQVKASFRRDKEEYIIQIVTYYNGLN